MKILAVERRINHWVSEADAALAADQVPEPDSLPVSLLTDSAVVRTGQPLFVPDFAREWQLEIVPYLSIGRLGKTIPPRFVPRYLDGWGLAARLRPAEAISAPQHPLSALALNFDGAFAPGAKMPLPPNGLPEALNITAEIIAANGADDVASQPPAGNLSEPHVSYKINEIVALISRYMMLKMGDIVIPFSTSLTVPVSIGSSVRATLNGTEALMLKLR
jgi:hypothetical protein